MPCGHEFLDFLPQKEASGYGLVTPNYGLGTMKFTYAYPRPMVTVDIAIVTRETKPRVLLIRRKHAPYTGMWALPGGYLNMDESLEEAARRELREETGVRAARLEQVHTFGDPGRDPRGRTITVLYLARIDPAQVKPQAADDAAEVGWHRLDRPPRLAFDHRQILSMVRKVVSRKVKGR
jgi:8-oxo-dGTP diphosphatase